MLIYFNDWHFFFSSWKCLCLCLFVYSSVCVLREECEGGHKILFPTLFTPVSTQHTGGQCWVRHLNKSHCCSWTHHSNRLPFKYLSIFLQSFNIWYNHWLTVLTQNLVIMNTEDEQQARDAEIRQVIIDSDMNMDMKWELCVEPIMKKVHQNQSVHLGLGLVIRRFSLAFSGHYRETKITHLSGNSKSIKRKTGRVSSNIFFLWQVTSSSETVDFKI